MLFLSIAIAGLFDNKGSSSTALAAGWDVAKEHYCLRPQKFLWSTRAVLDWSYPLTSSTSVLSYVALV